MTTAGACEMGVCPIGMVDFAKIQHLFALDPGHLLVHSLLGGKINSHQELSWSPTEQVYDLSSFQEEDSRRKEQEDNNTQREEIEL